MIRFANKLEPGSRQGREGVLTSFGFIKGKRLDGAGIKSVRRGKSVREEDLGRRQLRAKIDRQEP